LSYGYLSGIVDAYLLAHSDVLFVNWYSSLSTTALQIHSEVKNDKKSHNNNDGDDDDDDDNEDDDDDDKGGRRRRRKKREYYFDDDWGSSTVVHLSYPSRDDFYC
jgi:hypothetical protein